MAQKWWKGLSGLALVFSIQGAVAGDVWLVITSDQPGAAVFVDNVYRGVTPQRSSDALRIQAPQGTHEIKASVRIDGKDYVTRQAVDARGDRENPVQINLREETARASDAPTAPPVQAGKPPFETVIPVGELEVPGRNF